MERYLVRNGVILLKFFLHISKKEQKERLLSRINNESKNWKFSASDLESRKYWERYMKAYEDMINHTSTEWAPWYIIPSDHKWFARAAVADVIVSKMELLRLNYPKVSKEEKANLLKYKEILKEQ
jgi:polyphosphate kinase 2 (PPK2 family)